MTEEKKYKLDQVSVRLKLCEETPLYSTEAIDSPRKAIDVMKNMMMELDREYVCIVNIDNGGRPINFNVVSIGSVNAAPFTMREIMKAAILANASSILMLHNHPGYRTEKPKPSREDDCSTLRVMIAADFMGIPLRDHIIVSGGTGSCYSYRAEYGDKFNPMDMGKLLGDAGLDAVFAEPDRSAEYKPLAKVEELEEQNYNQIDNVINNTKPKAPQRRHSILADLKQRKAELDEREHKKTTITLQRVSTERSK